MQRDITDLWVCGILFECFVPFNAYHLFPFYKVLINIMEVTVLAPGMTQME